MTFSAFERPRPKSTPAGDRFAERSREATPGTRTFRWLTVGAAGMACLMALLPAAGHDQMWCLYAARLVLHGARLDGPQVFESNPPLIVWLSMVPAWLAGALHLPETAVGKALLTVVELGVLGVCLWLVLTLEQVRRRKWTRADLWALGFVFVATFSVMPARDFGERDHILVLLCLPYVLAAAMDAENIPIQVWTRIGIGMVAGVGIALKPHQILLPIVVETMVLWMRVRRPAGERRGSLVRLEPFLLTACGLAYAGAIRLFAPEYFTEIVPVLRLSYWAFGHLTWRELVGEALQLHLLAALTFVMVLVEGWRRASSWTLLLTAAGVASTFAYYLQGTGWYYQQLPALTFFSFALTFLVIDLTGRRGLAMPRVAPKIAAGLVGLALALTTHFAGYPFREANSFPIVVPDASFFAGLAPGTAVATLTTTVDYTVPPIFRYNLTLAQRYPHLLMLPAILRAESGDRRIPPAQLAWLEEVQHRDMREDFARWHPQLVLVERCQDPAVHCQVLEDRHDDLLGWFLRDPAFRAQFSGYHYTRSVGAFDAYTPN